MSWHQCIPCFFGYHGRCVAEGRYCECDCRAEQRAVAPASRGVDDQEQPT